MNTSLLKTVEQSYYQDRANFQVGDTVKVYNVIREGDKSRVQIFRGIVISRKGSGIRASFTVRKISDGIGVEKIFPLHSPNVQKIEIVRTGGVRRSKLYYMRKRSGKSALKIKAGRTIEAVASGDEVSEVETVEAVEGEQAEAKE